MKIKSMQFKVLITLLSAMLAITVFIGGLSIYEVDQFVQHQTVLHSQFLIQKTL